MPASLDAVFFVREPPKLELLDGMFHVSFRVGGMNAEFVLTPSTFTKAYRASARLLDEFHERETVVHIGRKKDRSGH